MNLGDVNKLRHAQQVLDEVYDYACRANTARRDERFAEMQETAEKLFRLIDDELAELATELDAGPQDQPKRRPRRKDSSGTRELF